MQASNKNIIPNLYIFRLRLGNKYFVGSVAQVDISAPPRKNRPLKKNSNLRNEHENEISEEEDNEVGMDNLTSTEAEILPEEANNSENKEPKETKETSKEEPTTPRRVSSNGTPIPTRLRPITQTNSITYTGFGINFDVTQALQKACGLLFNEAEPQTSVPSSPFDNLPSVFSKIGKDFTDFRDKLTKEMNEFGNENMKKIKNFAGKFNEGAKSSIEEDERTFEEGEAVEKEGEAIKFYLGVPVEKAAKILGFLDQSWNVILPNSPIITKDNIKNLFEEWQSFCQFYSIKLKWMHFVQVLFFNFFFLGV